MNRQIADRLQLSLNTIRTYVKRLLAMYGIEGARADAIIDLDYETDSIVPIEGKRILSLA